MSTSKRLTEVFESAKQKEILFDDSSKFILFSDCHRGVNGWADDFAQNQSLFFHALQKYYNDGFTYIELGDGDELLENRNFADIRRAHSHVFWLMRKFYRDHRLYLIYGNHDMARKDRKIVKRDLEQFYDERTRTQETLFEGIEVHEGLILRHEGTGDRIFLVHGHQGEQINDRWWRVSRFFVRYVWKPLQVISVHDPTSPAKNFKKRQKREREITEWITANNNQMLICGHTHRSVMPEDGEPPYFNTGSCVHPRCITGIEIQHGTIMLVKWAINAKADGTLYVERTLLDAPRTLQYSFATNSPLEIVGGQYSLVR